MLRLEVLSSSGGGARDPRRGRLTLDHGIVETPAFMPVGTAGTVKAARWSDVEAAGAEIVLANAYHLMLRPGGDVIRRLVEVASHARSPERAVDLQLGDFGVDVAMVLDECTPYPATEDAARASMELTHRWARRSIARRAQRLS